MYVILVFIVLAVNTHLYYGSFWDLGKVAVSKIVDYLRYTTSRGSEDSGLSELCNMLDPEKRDISMDLDTYHAIMKEWVDDCRNNA